MLPNFKEARSLWMLWETHAGVRGGPPATGPHLLQTNDAVEMRTGRSALRQRFQDGPQDLAAFASVCAQGMTGCHPRSSASLFWSIEENPRSHLEFRERSSMTLRSNKTPAVISKQSPLGSREAGRRKRTLFHFKYTQTKAVVTSTLLERL